MFSVSSEKEKAIRKKLDDLGIYEKDIRELFVRSHGKGGQKVNKTSTCVYLRHIPTGIEVKCRKARTQGLNRYYARVLLFNKIDRLIKGRKSEEEQRIAKSNGRNASVRSGPGKRCLQRNDCNQSKRQVVRSGMGRMNEGGFQEFVPPVNQA